MYLFFDCKSLALKVVLNTKVESLSLGEIKKLELSRLIIEQKKLWVLDEPFIGLDNYSLDIINQTLINHVKNGGILIFTSHIKPEIENLKILNLDNNG